VDKPTRHIVNEDTAQLSNTWVPLNVIGINRSLPPATDYTFFPSTRGQPPTQTTFSAIKHTFTDIKTRNIQYLLSDQSGTNKKKITEELQICQDYTQTYRENMSEKRTLKRIFQF
jgi:hypothetical protein